MKVKKEVVFEDGKGASVQLLPADSFSIKFNIDFPSKIVGKQNFEGDITEELFAKQIAPCRTFCEKYQVDYLKSIGIINAG
mgnify:CR=1 FL=1